MMNRNVYFFCMISINVLTMLSCAKLKAMKPNESEGVKIVFIVVTESSWKYDKYLQKDGEIYKTIQDTTKNLEDLKELINKNITEDNKKIQKIETCDISIPQFTHTSKDDQSMDLLNNATILTNLIKKYKSENCRVILITHGETAGADTIALASQLLNPENDGVQRTLNTNSNNKTYKKEKNETIFDQTFEKVHIELNTDKSTTINNNPEQIDAVIILDNNNAQYCVDYQMVGVGGVRHISLEKTVINKNITEQNIQTVHTEQSEEKESKCSKCWRKSQPVISMLGKILAVALPIIIELAIKGVL